MINDELQKIWKNMDTEAVQKSRDEFNLLLKSKARQSLSRYLSLVVFSAGVSIGLVIWVIITSINRKDDSIYLIHNAILLVVPLIALMSVINFWYKLQKNKFDLSLKEWLGYRIKLMTSGQNSKRKYLRIVILPLIYFLVTLSIHVYYENKPYLEVLKTEESLIGLAVGSVVGLFVSFYASNKVRKFQGKNIKFLEDMYKRLCREP